MPLRRARLCSAACAWCAAEPSATSQACHLSDDVWFACSSAGSIGETHIPSLTHSQASDVRHWSLTCLVGHCPVALQSWRRLRWEQQPSRDGGPDGLARSVPPRRRGTASRCGWTTSSWSWCTWSASSPAAACWASAAPASRVTFPIAHAERTVSATHCIASKEANDLAWRARWLRWPSLRPLPPHRL